ncbi:hypothetical protein, partial [Jatrophihabitans sp.]|uniref:hypothetical protein n=1 Tax=Jatrophihabitans sp. TaxID=1932789 RepID=UPI002F0E473C
MEMSVVGLMGGTEVGVDVEALVTGPELAVECGDWLVAGPELEVEREDPLEAGLELGVEGRDRLVDRPAPG